MTSPFDTPERARVREARADRKGCGGPKKKPWGKRTRPHTISVRNDRNAEIRQRAHDLGMSFSGYILFCVDTTENLPKKGDSEREEYERYARCALFAVRKDGRGRLRDQIKDWHERGKGDPPKKLRDMIRRAVEADGWEGEFHERYTNRFLESIVINNTGGERDLLEKDSLVVAEAERVLSEHEF